MDSKTYKLNNRLYYTNGAIAALYDESVDPETGEVAEDFEERLAHLLERDADTKDDAINEIKTRLAMIEARKAEISRLRDENDSDTKTIETLKTTLGAVLGGEKYNGIVGSVSYRRSKAVEIGDETYLSYWAQDKGLDIFTHPKPVISKTAVADLLNDGVSVPSASVVERVSVIVR